MSTTPLPDLPPVQEGLHLSALDSYLGQPGTLPGVSFWPRVGARVIDLVVHNLIALFSGLLIGILLAIVAGLRHIAVQPLIARTKPNGITVFAFGLLGTIVFEAICEGFHGSTPGKLLLSMVVVQEDGSPCRPGSAWSLSLSYILHSPFFGLIAYLNIQKTPPPHPQGAECPHTLAPHHPKVAPQ